MCAMLQYGCKLPTDFYGEIKFLLRKRPSKMRRGETNFMVTKIEENRFTAFTHIHTCKYM